MFLTQACQVKQTSKNDSRGENVNRLITVEEIGKVMKERKRKEGGKGKGKRKERKAQIVSQWFYKQPDSKALGISQ